MKNSSCGPKSFPKWVRIIITALLSEECCKYHDQLYDHLDLSREDADAIFLDCLESKKIPKWKLKIVKYFINKYGEKYHGKSS